MKVALCTGNCRRRLADDAPPGGTCPFCGGVVQVFEQVTDATPLKHE